MQHEVDHVKGKMGFSADKGKKQDPVAAGKAADPAGLDQQQIEQVMLEGTGVIVKGAAAAATESAGAPPSEPSQAAQLDAHADEEAHEAADVVANDRDDVSPKDV